jgi:hypothetical protein
MSNVTGTLSLNVPAITALCVGPRGASILVGNGIPTLSVGATGDLYIDLNTYNLYGPKQGGALGWPGVPIVSLVQTVSTTGFTIYSGVTSNLVSRYGNNRTYGTNLAILGGSNNTLSGDSSFIIGSNITAAVTGFVLTTNLSSTGTIFASAGNSNLWSNTSTTLNTSSGRWESSYTTLCATSGVWTSYQNASGTFLTSIPGSSTYTFNTGTSSLAPVSGNNTAAGTWSNIAGGCGNSVSGDCSSILGGRNNKINSSVTFATIGGGDANLISNNYSTIAGGLVNSATYLSFVGGGDGNCASGNNSTIGGGHNNCTSGNCSLIGGGSINSNSGNYSSIIGGSYNCTNGVSTIIGGGYCNRLTANCSVIGGGACNYVDGQYSFATGFCNNTKGYNNVSLLGTGLSAIQQNTTYVNNISSQCNALIGGSVGVGGTPSYALDVQGNSSSTATTIRAYNSNTSSTSNASICVQNGIQNGYFQAYGNAICMGGGASNNGSVYITNNGNTGITVLTSGNVQIGYPLTINGATTTSYTISANNQITTSGPIGAFFANDRNTTGQSAFYRASDITRLQDTAYGDVITYNNSGNVGIATPPIASTRLSVNGSVSAASIAINTANETKSAPTIATNALTLNLSAATLFVVSLNDNITTMTFSNPPASTRAYSFILQFVADGTARAVTWPASVKWPGGNAPSLTSTLNKTDTFVFVTYDNGTNYFGFTSGLNS